MGLVALGIIGALAGWSIDTTVSYVLMVALVGALCGIWVDKRLKHRPKGTHRKGPTTVHVSGRTFAESAQEIADAFKQSAVVVLGLREADTDESRRLLDFSSGVAYALDGDIQRIGDRVYLISPPGIGIDLDALVDGPKYRA